jgi:hypothetical protein
MRVLRRSGVPPSIVMDTRARRPHRRSPGDDVRQGADAPLQLLRRGLHDRRVEPGARHHEEDALVGRIGRIGGVVTEVAGGIVVGRGQPPDVDAAVVPGQRDPRGRSDIGGQAQRAGEQVARARGHQAHRDPAARRADCATARTVPSPPQAITTSAPLAMASARLARCPGPSSVVGSHSGGAQPSRAQTARSALHASARRP